MNSLRFVATCLITVILLALSAFLLEPTRHLVLNYRGNSLGPGVLPAICLGGVSVIILYVFFLELRLFLRSRGTVEDPREQEAQLGLPLRDFLIKSAFSLALLWAYILLWQLTSFVPATIFFAVCMGIGALSPGERVRKRIIGIITVFGLFSIFVWWVFASLLNVHLD